MLKIETLTSRSMNSLFKNNKSCPPSAHSAVLLLPDFYKSHLRADFRDGVQHILSQNFQIDSS